MRRHQHGAPFGRQPLLELPDPQNALGIQPVQYRRIAQQSCRDIPDEKPPTRRPATADSPTKTSTSSTRAADSRFVRVSHRRCSRAERFGCTQCASNNAPTTHDGSRCDRYRFPFTSARPARGPPRPRIRRIVVDLPAPFGPEIPSPDPAGPKTTIRSPRASVAVRQVHDLNHRQLPHAACPAMVPRIAGRRRSGRPATEQAAGQDGEAARRRGGEYSLDKRRDNAATRSDIEQGRRGAPRFQPIVVEGPNGDGLPGGCG